jgi:hypothetical protein
MPLKVLVTALGGACGLGGPAYYAADHYDQYRRHEPTVVYQRPSYERREVRRYEPRREDRHCRIEPWNCRPRYERRLDCDYRGYDRGGRFERFDRYDRRGR